MKFGIFLEFWFFALLELKGWDRVKQMWRLVFLAPVVLKRYWKIMEANLIIRIKIFLRLKIVWHFWALSFLCFQFPAKTNSSGFSKQCKVSGKIMDTLIGETFCCVLSEGTVSLLLSRVQLFLLGTPDVYSLTFWGCETLKPHFHSSSCPKLSGICFRDPLTKNPHLLLIRKWSMSKVGSQICQMW